MSGFDSIKKSTNAGTIIGKVISYTVFIAWALITVLPLIWMFYSSFKSNEELTMSSFSLPHEMIFNYNDEYVVIKPDLNVRPNWDTATDKRERIVIESTTIAPGRRMKIEFLVKEDMPPEIQNLKVGDTLRLSQLPAKDRRRISWGTLWWNYTSSFTRGDLGYGFMNSILYSCVATFLIVMLSLMIGFGLSKMGFPRLSMVISALIGLGYLLSIHSVIIPLFLMLSSIGLVNTHIGIILVYTAFGLPMSVLLSTQFLRGLPDSLVESAYIDGASTLRTFISIIVPMSVPVAITVSIINALGIWNEFLLVMVLSSNKFTRSLPAGVYSFASLTSIQFGWQLAAMVMAVLPVMIVYFIFNKRLAKGVVAGAIKG